MKIGTIAKKAGVHIETVRYYERRGIIEEPERRDSGYRIYDGNTVRRIRFIKKAQELGFSLAEIETLLSLRTQQKANCNQVKSEAEAKFIYVDTKINELQRIRTALLDLIDSCKGDGPLSDCPILDALDIDSQNENINE